MNTEQPDSIDQRLFDHMSREHGLTLMESEMDEIRRICAEDAAKQPAPDAAETTIPDVCKRIGQHEACDGDRPYGFYVHQYVQRELSVLRARLADAAEAGVKALREESEMLTWLIKQGPPGAAEAGLGLTQELWDAASCQEAIEKDQNAVRDAIRASMKENSEARGD